MKASHFRLFILLTIVSVVLFGNSSINNDSQAPNPFAVAHASLQIPAFEEDQQACRNGKESPDSLLVPPEGSFYLQDYEKKLYEFILQRRYDTDLNWCVDRRVRDTGPFVKGEYYGIHPAVRMYYSPKVMYWLTGNPDYWQEGKASGKAKPRKPREGDVPEGAMIIKEMFLPPADIYMELESLIMQSKDCAQDSLTQYYDYIVSHLITSWTVMVKAGANSKDGWFWANPGAPSLGQDIETAVNGQLDDYSHMQFSSFGQPTCLRCHASAEKDFTFSALENVKGSFRLDQDSVFQFCPKCPEENLVNYYTDSSWRDTNYVKNNNGAFFSKLFAAAPACVDRAAVKQLFELSPWLRPYAGQDELKDIDFNPHMRPLIPLRTASAPRNPGPNPAFLETYPAFSGLNEKGVKVFPSQWADHVVQGAKITSHYITSDNCLGCHGGLGGAPPAVTMFVQTGPKYGDGYNLSEYGEWRWSPMGLAGRDPIFFAQLESEMEILKQDAIQKRLPKTKLKELQEQVVSTCMSCHGAMGQRQLKIDAKADKNLDPLFKVDYVYLTEALSKKEKVPDNYQYHKYGELAREGISCTVCHHIDAPKPEDVTAWQPKQPNWVNKNTPKELAYYLFHHGTGQYVQGPANMLNGPFNDVKEMPMKDVLDITPTHNEFTKNSQMCGSCHTISLPNIGQAIKPNSVLNAAEQNPTLQPFNHTIEQATFLEWQNSSFAVGKTFKSCQDCHMPGGFQSLDGKINIGQITTQIATIQDANYPEVDNGALLDDIRIPFRKDYRRHEHVGLNVFLLALFDQFPGILGVSNEKDPMTYATNGNALATENMLRQARSETVDLNFRIDSFTAQGLKVAVSVKNKTGHRFPSGVSFRRAFLEVLVMQGDEVVWGSGRTNSVGVIVDENGRPLKTEFLEGSKNYQHHHQRITQQNQVQIYEELNQNAQKEFTTSFIHRVFPIKDNRLLPQGWRASSYFASQGDVITQFMQATDPEGVEGDKDYEDQGAEFPGMDQLVYDVALPKGIDPSKLSVKVTMYYQSIPPYYLNQRFSTAPNGEATQRLFYLTSNLQLERTAMRNWKLPLVTKQLIYCKDARKWVERGVGCP